MELPQHRLAVQKDVYLFHCLHVATRSKRPENLQSSTVFRSVKAKAQCCFGLTLFFLEVNPLIVRQVEVTAKRLGLSIELAFMQRVKRGHLS